MTPLLQLRAAALGAAQGLRARLPLYFNDEARLATRHAGSLLAVAMHPGAPISARLRAARTYARLYRMLSSVERFADRLATLRDPDAILHGLERDADASTLRFARSVRRELRDQHGLAPEPRRPLRQAPVERRRLRLRSRTSPPGRRVFGRVRLQGERVEYVDETISGGADTAPTCLVVGASFREEDFDLSHLADIRDLRVIDLVFSETPGRLDAIRSALPDARVTLRPTLADEVAQYTPGDQAVSDTADALGRAVLARITRHVSARRRLHPAMDDVLALRISDQSYRYIQRLHAAVEAVRRVLTEHPDARVVVTDPAFAPALAHLAPTWLLCAEGRGLPRGRPNWAGDAPTHSPRDVALALRAVDADLAARLAPHTRPQLSPLPRLVLATSSRMSAYREAGASLRSHLQGRWNVHTLDFRPPPTLREFASRPSDPLSLAVTVSRTPDADILSDTVLEALSQSLRDIGIAGLPGPVAFLSLRAPILHIAPSLFSLRALHAGLVESFGEDPPASVLLLPGRPAQIRTVAAAARAAEVPVVDLQVLFVSTMARYKPPVADRFLVIDRQTRDLYLRHYGLPPARVEAVGSLQLDREMAAVRATDPSSERRRLGLPPNSFLVTYGAQSHPRDFIRARALDIATFCDTHPDTSLCIKLHPSHSRDLKLWLEAELRAAHPRLPFSVELETDFARVLAATSVLVTHFSNVGVSAAAADVPVVAMPTPDGLSGIDLTKLGAAVSATDRAELHAALAERLGPDASPLPYRERNPNMGDGGTLARVEQTLREVASLSAQQDTAA